MFLLLRPDFYSFFDPEETFLLLRPKFYSFLVVKKCSYFYVRNFTAFLIVKKRSYFYVRNFTAFMSFRIGSRNGTSNGNGGSCNSQLYLTLIRATMENLIDR